MRRQTATGRFIYDVPPRPAQRLDDPLHRTPAQELVSVDAEFTRRTCEDTHEDARRRRRVTRIERRLTLLRGQASQPSPADHDGSIGSLPNVDAELPENGKVVFDVLGLGKIADRARAVGQGRHEGGALGDRLVARRTPNDLASARHVEAYGDGSFPAPPPTAGPAPIRMWCDMRSMTSVSLSSVSVSL